ncbi:YOR285W-like protein, partial [Eremomyces bilateralis CBS 781.70]
IKELSTKPDPERILIDVREPTEFTSGHIPRALNLPITSSPDFLFLPPAEFADRFGMPKPQETQELVFYCKAGVRSKAAAEMARRAGYGRVGEYKGSWVDWVGKGGERA